MHNWRVWLADWIGKPETHFLEIGSYEGRSAVWFLQNVLTHPTSTLDCIDLFTGKGLEPRFDHNIHKSGRSGQVRKHKGRSDAILPELPEAYFDVIYVDGSHRAADVLLDAALSWCLLKCNGLIIFDDYLWEMSKPAAQRPQIAIDLFLEAYAPRLRVVHHGYQVVVRRTS
ncbi:MAG: class I SAM-dependent methyltransferase [Anaerolineae bacterium]|nr:class I SAM-dependent methyltransferase [Candidatus Roseilinea sp.]MDW8449510.1 class I SAM-dependent methyltransferase [Anaerolineae bacterium]